AAMSSATCPTCYSLVQFQDGSGVCPGCGKIVLDDVEMPTPRRAPALPAGLIAVAATCLLCACGVAVLFWASRTTDKPGADKSGPDKPGADAPLWGRPAQFTASELAARYAADADAAQRDLAGKTIEVTAEVASGGDGVIVLNVPQRVAPAPPGESPADT